jgi:CRP-like cAMP-binding protein
MGTSLTKGSTRRSQQRPQQLEPGSNSPRGSDRDGPKSPFAGLRASIRDLTKGHSYHVAEEEDDANAAANSGAKPDDEKRSERRSNSLFVNKNGKRGSSPPGGLPRYQSFDAILTIPFFEDLTPARAKQLSTLFDREIYQADDVIVREQKDKEQSFYVIIQGSVRLTARRKPASKFSMILVEFLNWENALVDEKDDEEHIIHLSDLEKGACFGTTALISSDDKMVPITAIAQVNGTIVMSISREKFSQFAQEHDLFPCLKAGFASSTEENPEPLSVLFRLRSLPFFMGMDDYLLRQLGVLFEFRRYNVGEKIITQGQALEGFYVLVKGVVEITIALADGQVKHFGTIKPQDCFGEMALIEQTVGLADYTVRTETVVVILRAERFDRFRRLAPDVINHEHFKNLVRRRTADALKRIPIFSIYQTKQFGPLEQYDENTLGLLAGLFQFVEYQEGEDFYKQGDLANSFFIIVQGEVQVWSEATVDGEQDIQVEELRDGAWFGDVALCNTDEKEISRRTENVTALQKTVVLRLSSAYFSQFRELAPQVCAQVEQRLSMKTAAKLETIPFFKGIRENRPWSKIGLLGTLFKFELFETGSTIFKEGEVGDKFYVIVEGKVAVTAHEENSNEMFELETLSHGQWFGEMSLLLHTPRSATITTKMTTVVLSLTTDAFKRFLEIAPELNSSFQALVTSRTANALKKFKFFKNVKENRAWSKLELLAALMSYEVFEPNQEVFHKGSRADKFYIIATGAVDVLVDSKHEEKAVQRIDHLEQGSYFGEIALLEETERTATVVCSKQTVLLAITNEKFRKFLQIAPELKSLIDNMIHRRKRTLSKGVPEEFDFEAEHHN